jgi:hypothetical protein
MKKILLVTIALVFGFLLTSAAWYYTKINTRKSRNTHRAVHVASDSKLMERLHQRTGNLLLYARQHGYNTRTCFLIDLSKRRLPHGIAGLYEQAGNHHQRFAQTNTATHFR